MYFLKMQDFQTNLIPVLFMRLECRGLAALPHIHNNEKGFFSKGLLSRATVFQLVMVQGGVFLYCRTMAIHFMYCARQTYF